MSSIIKEAWKPFLKVIDKANMDNLSVVLPGGKSVANSRALTLRRVDNLRYIQSRMPELLMTAPNSRCDTLLEERFFNHEDYWKPNQESVLDSLCDPLSKVSDFLRFLFYFPCTLPL